MEALTSGDSGLCLAELEQVSAAQLWPRDGTLRALAGLLTAEEPEVSKAAASYLSSGAAHTHFRNKVRCGVRGSMSLSGRQQQRLCDCLWLQKGVTATSHYKACVHAC